MKKIHIVHNPTAGDGKHTKEELLDKVGMEGGTISYFSTEEPGWKSFLKKEPDVILVGGGDGTFQKVAEVLLEEGAPYNKIPVGLLPLGTANNIATTLGIEKGDFSLSGKAVEEFDVGRIKSSGKTGTILEGVGFGIFPRLMKEMEKDENKSDDPEKELKRSREILLDLVREYPAREAEFRIGKENFKGTFLLAEVMNIKLIGPNFELAPGAKIGDGNFDLVTIAAEKRPDLMKHLEQVLYSKAGPGDILGFAETRRVKALEMKWEGQDIHFDDDPMPEYSGESFGFETQPHQLRLLVRR